MIYMICDIWYGMIWYVINNNIRKINDKLIISQLDVYYGLCLQFVDVKYFCLYLKWCSLKGMLSLLMDRKTKVVCPELYLNMSMMTKINIKDFWWQLLIPTNSSHLAQSYPEKNHLGYLGYPWLMRTHIHWLKQVRKKSPGHLAG